MSLPSRLDTRRAYSTSGSLMLIFVWLHHNTNTNAYFRIDHSRGTLPWISLVEQYGDISQSVGRGLYSVFSVSSHLCLVQKRSGLARLDTRLS